MIHLGHYTGLKMSAFLLFINNKCPLIMVHDRGGAAKLFMGFRSDIISCHALARVQVSVTVLKGFADVVAVRD